MLRALLDSDSLACPACRGFVDGQFRDHALCLSDVFAERAGRIWQAMLTCAGCRLRYPVIDGVAVVFRDVGGWLRQQERPVLGRDDLAPPLASWLAAAWPDDQDPNWRRQMLATYAGRLHPEPDATDPLGRALQGVDRAARAWLADRRAALIAAAGPSPLVLDVGTATGEAALHAASLGARVLALDHDFAGLRLLSHLVTDGHATAPRWRHGGHDYTTVTLTAPPNASRVLPIAADAADPPLRGGIFDVLLAYNVLDNVASPVTLLRQLNGVLRAGGTLALSSPYDWVSRCTPIPNRIGAAIRVDANATADAAPALRDLLQGHNPQAPELALRLTVDDPDLPWVLRRHDRSWHAFRAHYVEARKPPARAD